MKKISLYLFLALSLILLCHPVFAEEVVSATSVTVTAELPVAGKISEEVKEENIRIAYVSNSQNKILSAPLEFALIGSGWYDNSTGSSVKLRENDSFLSGRSYTLKIQFEIFDPNVSIDGETGLYINGTHATLSKQGSAYEMSCQFVCTPSNIAPKVSLVVESEKSKEYDGKGIELSAVVEKTAGVEYRFEWFCNAKLVPDANTEKLVIKNVADSGKYHCKVYAAIAGEPDENAQFTETTAHEITITPKSITIQIENAEKNLFDNDPAFSYTVLGEIYDELSGNPERESGEDIGTYSIKQGTLTFAPEILQNYNLTVKNGTLNILSVDDLPFSAVATLADLSYITGKDGSKIRVSASKGAIRSDAILKLSISSESDQKTLKDYAKKEVLKSFTVSVVDSDGKTLTLPKHATLRIQIPLTKEEASFVPETLTAAILTTSPEALETTIVEEGQISYLAIETKKTGTIALFEGEKTAAPPVSENTPQEAPEEEAPLVLWILIVLVTFVAVGAIVFTVIWTKKNRVSMPKSTTPPKATKVQNEKIRRIADQINAMPPTPQKEKAEAEKEGEKKDPPQKKNVISFEDLED